MVGVTVVVLSQQMLQGYLMGCEQDNVGKSGNEIGTRGTQVYVLSVEDHYVLYDHRLVYMESPEAGGFAI
jgi:hypothetical protein